MTMPLPAGSAVIAVRALVSVRLASAGERPLFPSEPAVETWHIVAAGAFTSACGQPPIAGVVTQRCVEGPEPGPTDDGVSGVFTWTPGSAGEQWIDLSVDGGAFAPGMYQGYGPVASGAASHEIAGIARGVTYYWRVNVRTPGGWLTSAPASFETLACPRP